MSSCLSLHLQHIFIALNAYIWVDIVTACSQLNSFQVLGETLPYDTLQQVRGRLSEVAPNLTRYGLVEEANFFAQAAEAAALKAKTEKLSKDPIDVAQKVLEDFYMTDPITRYRKFVSFSPFQIRE